MNLVRLIGLLAYVSMQPLVALAVAETTDFGRQAKQDIKKKFAGEDHWDTLDRLRNHDQSKMEQFRSLYAEKKGLLDDHNSGRRKLSEDDLHIYTRQMNAFKERIDHVDGMTDEQYENYIRQKAENLHKVRNIDISEL